MVRTVIVEDTIKCDIEKITSDLRSCTILIGTSFEEKRYILTTFHVPISNNLENDFEGSVFQLLYALPGGCYPIGIVSTEKILSLLGILRKLLQKLQKLVPIDSCLLEPIVTFKAGNKIDSKVLIDGQLKPITTKFISFFSTWNQVSSYVNIQQHLDLPKFENMKQWRISFRTEVAKLIKDLNSCKVHISGNKFKNDKSYFEDPGKSKNSIGKILHPKLIFPLVSSKMNLKPNISKILGSLYTHVYVPPKLTTEQIRELILEDIAKSLFCRTEAYCEFGEGGTGTDVTPFDHSMLRLPYRVTFPLGLIELSVYLLQDEKISQASQVASELFDVMPTNLKSHEECQESKGTAEFVGGSDEEEKDNQLKVILLATIGGVIAVLASVIFLSDSNTIN